MSEPVLAALPQSRCRVWLMATGDERVRLRCFCRHGGDRRMWCDGCPTLRFAGRIVRRGKAREMRALIGQLVDGLRLPIPTDPDALFAALIASVSEMRGREVLLIKEEFPHQTASGLFLDLPAYDLIVVDKRATPLHQLAIFFHEVWHMLKGDCGNHLVGKTVATRLLSTYTSLPELHETVRKVAARTEFNRREEADAERFGLLAVAQVRVWLEGEPDSTSTDRDRIAGRIGASLGHRRPQV
ncbi:toxin-antitoxin system, toxin component [Streptomyces sp. NPDC008313]|uniref:toxin-antitoxin system, toxin component n=1 Tax=Streptomyces sp. NPDC008313 TaxID=3364826 RepID=UPI0036E80461